ncbi:MAG: hypothetical protein ABUL63_05565, partial [Acidobacteriota bacterium]
DAVGLQRATTDIPKTWEKVEKLESLLAFDVGTVVAMEGKGVGRIAEANLGLESFKVDFERIKGMTVGFKAAAKLLQPLTTEHVLRRKLEDPKGLGSLAPPELLKITLLSYDRPLTAGEVRDIVTGIVKESQWTSWWSAARKHSHVVATGTGSRQTYRWAESGADAVESLWKAFEKADPRKKIERMKRDGARDPGLRARMAENMEKVAAALAPQDPGLAFEIWFALERTGGAPEDVSWSPDSLLELRDVAAAQKRIDELRREADGVAEDADLPARLVGQTVYFVAHRGAAAAVGPADAEGSGSHRAGHAGTAGDGTTHRRQIRRAREIRARCEVGARREVHGRDRA